METQNETYTLPLLTPFLRDEIIFAMEDQESLYFLDLKTGRLVQSDEIDEEEQEDFSDRFLPVPDWEPADGFRMMDKFSNLVRNPLYREKLQNALQAGKGVFRRFKDILCEQPALERQWFAFKDLEMERKVLTWYKSNNGAIQLKGLEPEPEELTDDILQEDFVLYTETTGESRQELEELKQSLLEEMQGSGITQKKSSHLIRSRLESAADLEFVYARTQGGELAGFIAYRLLSVDTAEILFFGNRPDFRGLGLFRHLFDAFTRKVSRKGILFLVVNLAGEAITLDKLFSQMEGTIITKQVLISTENWNSSQTSSDLAYL
ncbi:GNAT family N-acetyltransferase [Sphaerochaeta pleomorpha]|nr:GNAT family N-acetyltransferase [Sphaerochaeta pleomorpha]